MNAEKKLALTFDSDWHIGSGAGIPGSLYRQVLRDDHGLPYVPGKTLTGIIRDAAEWIAATRDSAEGGCAHRWTDAVSGLFGVQTPDQSGKKEHINSCQPAAMGISSAVFSPEMQAYFKENPEILPLLFISQSGVMIDRKKGVSAEEHLFSTEKVRQGCVLFATMRFNRPLTDDEGKLLVDAIKAVRHIGGKRRRGGGKCTLSLSDTETKNENRISKDLPGSVADSEYIELSFRLTTLQPVIVNKVTLGNVTKTDNIIPGVMLLPYFTREIFASLGKERMVSAIMNGELSIGNFLPDFEGKQGYPVPLSFTRKKERSETGKNIYNRLVEGNVSEEGKAIQMKEVRTGYVVLGGEKNESPAYYPAENQITLRTHNTIEDSKQRPTEKVGGLFTYEAIKQDSVFRGFIKISGKLWNEIRKTLSDPDLARLCKSHLSIGQSRKDEYGRVELEYANTKNNSIDCASLDLIEKKGSSYLVVYLLSDTLIRNGYLGYTSSLDDLREVLQKELAVDLVDVPDDELSQQHVNGRSITEFPLGGEGGHFIRTHRRESWHSVWGLPRPTLLYFQAGSVLLFKVANPNAWDRQKARELMDKGLGDRIAEGYGRVLLNPIFCTSSDVSEASRIPTEETPQPSPPQNDADPFIILLKGEYVKKHLRQSIRCGIYGESKNKTIHNLLTKAPTNAQCGSLREAATLIQDQEGFEAFKGWFDNSKNKKNGKEKFLNASWRDFVTDILKAPETIFDTIFPTAEAKQRVLAHCHESHREILKYYALRTFFDVLTEHIFDKGKEKKQKEEEARA